MVRPIDDRVLCFGSIAGPEDSGGIGFQILQA